MKNLNLFIMPLLLVAVEALGQTSEKKAKHEHGKNDVYITQQGLITSWRNFDSLRYKANHYVGKKKIRETEDSVYYSITHFDKSLAADLFQTQGVYCGNDNRKSLDEIKKQYPYTKTVSIKVVSFKDSEIPRTDKRIDFQKMFEVKTLNADLSNKMIDILANYVSTSTTMEVAFCYEPRNAVMLLDKDEKVIACVEICFECQRYKIYPEHKLFGFFCNEKLDAIQGIFMRAGIMYGMKVEY